MSLYQRVRGHPHWDGLGNQQVRGVVVDLHRRGTGYGRLPHIRAVKRQKILTISELRQGGGSRALSSVARRHRL